MWRTFIHSTTDAKNFTSFGANDGKSFLCVCKRLKQRFCILELIRQMCFVQRQMCLIRDLATLFINELNGINAFNDNKIGFCCLCIQNKFRYFPLPLYKKQWLALYLKYVIFYWTPTFLTYILNHVCEIVVIIKVFNLTKWRCAKMYFSYSFIYVM